MSSQIYAKEYEDYLISGNEDSINTLPNGSIEKDYFLMFCDEVIVIRLELDREKERRQQYQVLWKALNISIENISTHELLDINDAYIELIHDALCAYGRNGDMNNKKYNIGFVF